MASSAATSDDTSPDPSKGRGSSRRRTHPVERRAVYAVVGISALGAAFAPGRPCGLLVADIVIRASFGGLIALAGSRARRLPLLVASGVAATAADGIGLVGLALAGLFVGLYTAVADRRGRLLGTVMAASAVNVLLRLTTTGFNGISAVIAIAGVLPVVVSGYRNAPRKERARVRSIALGVSVVTAGLTLLFSVALLEARAHVERGITDARNGLGAIRRGDEDAAVANFDDAAQSFSDAHSSVGAFWVQPARVVPLLGQHLRAMVAVTDAGSDLAATARLAATQADVRNLQFTGGVIDLDLIASFREPLDSVVQALTDADHRIAEVSSPWLAAPLQDRIGGLRDDIHSALPQAKTALEAVTVAPALLGADGPRHYFIAFITPSEERGLGGFMGNYGELTADAGKVSLTRSGRTVDLRPKKGDTPPPLTSPPAPEDYVRRYGPLKPNFFIQDIPVSPDFPTVAQVFEEIYPEVEGGERVDGVIALDPYALAALLRYTGPIKLEGLDGELNMKNAADLLLRTQYTEFPDRGERTDFLDQATSATFEKLTNATLPDPRTIANQLSPLVAQGRLMAQSTHPDEQNLFERIGMANAYPPVGSGDFFGITSQNSGNNKIDIFLDRTITYAATFDPSTGAIDATATIALHNASPADGLPAIVIDNSAGLPPGTNQLFLSVYSPLTAVSWKIDGVDAAFNALPELGRQAYASLVNIPPGATVTVEVHLQGSVPGIEQYVLTMGNQPMITNDTYHVTITPAGGARFSTGGGFKIDGGVADTTFVQDQDVVLTASLRR